MKLLNEAEKSNLINCSLLISIIIPTSGYLSHWIEYLNTLNFSSTYYVVNRVPIHKFFKNADTIHDLFLNPHIKP